MTDTALVVVRTFRDRIEAELAQSALQAAGIGSMVRGDDAGGVQPGLWTGEGVDVLVREEDTANALAILEGHRRSDER
jgi:hypothetical protein